MSDTAIFILLSSDDLKASGSLPGELRSLKVACGDEARITQIEVISDGSLPGKTLQALCDAGVRCTLLPSAGPRESNLCSGLMGRLHETLCAYAHLDAFLLAGTEVELMVPAARFLRQSGYAVTLASTESESLEEWRSAADECVVWSSRGGNASSGNRSEKNKQDPYEILVDEITKSREKGNRVLLTSLKQRMRRRIRRFDETRLKDSEGRPMRKFKDFVVDAANRGLIQLVERGNASQILLPGEDIPEEDEEEIREEENNNNTENSPKKKKSDPLLESVDSAEGEDQSPAEIDPELAAGDPSNSDEDVQEQAAPIEEEEAEEEQPQPLQEGDFVVNKVREEAAAPPKAFMEFLDNMMNGSPKTLAEIVDTLNKAQESGDLDLSYQELGDALQNALYNELLESDAEEMNGPLLVVDDWRRIIDFL